MLTIRFVKGASVVNGEICIFWILFYCVFLKVLFYISIYFIGDFYSFGASFCFVNIYIYMFIQCFLCGAEGEQLSMSQKVVQLPVPASSVLTPTP